jgi:ABC-type transport system substrate-binding protein
LAFGLIAAACGSDDSESGSGTTAGGGAGTTAAGGAGTTAAASDLTPVQGGKLVVGIEADTGSPWVPSKFTCAASCYVTIGSVFDTLAAVTEDGEVVPYLAESITPNEDYTVWTFVAREGVTFHDGTPFDGAAMVDNITRQYKSFLTGKVFADVATNPDGTPQIVLTDPMTMTITLKRPWVVFPIYLAAQPGFMASPTWLAAADADTTLEAKPVGTGPFIFKDYKPGESFTATRNPDYWNQPYPYLDEYETRVIPDALTRASALEAGDVDIIHTTNGDTVAKFRDDPENFPMLEETDYGETGYTLLHVTQEGSPLTDVRVRCALAESTDAAAIIQQTQAGVPAIANGPFSPAQAGYLEDTGFPVEQDMEAAKALIADYKAENPGPLEINLSTTQDATNLIIAQAQQQFYTEAGVDEVQISQIEQAKYILTALQGDFQAFQWRNHGGYDLDSQLIWWTADNALPVGELALNFGRIKDDVIDEALAANRGETDPALKQEYAETVNKRFGEQCYNLWIFWTVWGIPHTPAVMDVGVFTLPDGSTQSPGTGGTFNQRSVWINPDA